MFSTPFLIIKAMLSLPVFGSDNAEDISDNHIETVRDYDDNILVRSKRSDNTGKNH